MKPDKKADDLLREKLNSYSSPVPVGLFDAMDKKREEQQTASAFGWRIKAGISAMVLLLGIGLICWQIIPYTNNASILVAETAISNTDNQTTVKEVKKDKTKQAIAQIQTKLREQKNSTNPIESIERKAFIDNTQQQIKSRNSSAPLPTNLTKVRSDMSDVFKQTSFIKTPTESNESSFTSEKSNETLKEIFVLPSDNVSVAKAEVVGVGLQESVRQSVLVNPLANKSFFADTKRYAAMPKIECGWEARKVYLYFDVITSIDMAFRTLSPKDADGEVYAILRNQTEGMQESTSLGFRASAVTKGGFAMRTGLIYSKIKEPFSQRITIYEERIITTTDANNNVLSIDTLLVPVTQNFAYANHHKLLDIPVIFAYEMDKEKYNIGFNAGAYINITASQDGRILSPSSEIVDISTSSPNRYNAFKTNVGVSLYSSFAINYKITPAVHFIFEPYGRYYLNSFTTANHELKQNYFVGGMQIGLRMKM